MIRCLKVFFCFFVFACSCPTQAGELVPPENIILFIGDGMGVSHVTAALVMEKELNMKRFKIMGLLTTHSANSFVTDSAASGTALATGFKTCNGFVAVDLEKRLLKTAVEYAKEAGKKTGVVVTCSVTHATPAVFLSHVDGRGKQSLIAEQIVASEVDVLFGGGLGYFLPASMENSLRKDNKNLLEQMAGRTKVVQSYNEFTALGGEDTVAGFFAKEEMPLAIEREPGLAEMTGKAIKILANGGKGFFLMVEGSQIDWGGHSNSQDIIISEIIDFDRAVGVGLDFAQSNGRTLVIVASDHETGGFAIHNGSIVEQKVMESAFTSRNHTAAMVPLFAYGPCAESFGGIMDNAEAGQVIIQLITGSVADH